MLDILTSGWEYVEYLTFYEVGLYLFVDMKMHSVVLISLHTAQRIHAKTSAFAKVSLRQVAETQTVLQLSLALTSCKGTSQKRIFLQINLTGVFAEMNAPQTRQIEEAVIYLFTLC